MTECRRLTMEELSQISGGIVIKDGDVYMALSDDAMLLKPASLNVKEAQKVARQLGWSDEVLTPAEFARRYGHEYNGDDYWLPTDDGFWGYDDPSEWYWPWEA